MVKRWSLWLFLSFALTWFARGKKGFQMADSKLRSLSSVALSTGLPAPQICISISASRFSTSHCCRLSLALREAFSDSSMRSRSRSRLISATIASAGGSSCFPVEGMFVRLPATLEKYDTYYFVFVAKLIKFCRVH